MSQNKKTYLPITLDISDQRILVIGGELDALKKVNILRRFTDSIDVLAANLCDEMIESGVSIITKPYDETLLKNYVLVYVSTDDLELEKRVIADGRRQRVLVNVHDKPDLCQFISPAIFQYKNFTVAVGSNGENVYESIKIRDAVAAYLSTKYFNN